MTVPATTGILRTSLEGMEIGDYISCRYRALSSNSVGNFSELGTCTANEIPVTGSAIPDGLFYFVKVDKGLLIADRVVQHTITWDNLNTGKYIEGKYSTIYKKVNPNMTSYSLPSPFSVLHSVGDDGNGSAWKAFDGDLTTYAAMQTSGAFLTLQLDIQKTVNSYYITFQDGGWGSSPTGWTLSGSNDNNNWTVLDVRSGLSSWTLMEKRLFSFSNSISYKYYKIHNLGFRAGATAGICSFGEIEFVDSSYNTIQALFRSISGGNSYTDSSGNSSIDNKGLGAFPIINEWDKYIRNSELSGKIIKGDNNVWHWNNYVYCWCRETPIIAWNDSARRISRGYDSLTALAAAPSSTSNISYGFRPVLEYIESDGSSNQTNLWY